MVALLGEIYGCKPIALCLVPMLLLLKEWQVLYGVDVTGGISLLPGR